MLNSKTTIDHNCVWEKYMRLEFCGLACKQSKQIIPAAVEKWNGMSIETIFTESSFK